MKAKTLGELAEHVGGRVLGDANLKITSAATLEQAGTGDISFLSNPRYTRHLKTTRASAVVIREEIDTPANLLVADDPYYAFTQIMVLLHGHRQHKKTGISPRSVIAETARIGKDVHIHDFVTISDNARIGDRSVLYPGVFIGPDTHVGADCIFYPNAVVYDRCRIGNRVIIHANATIGEDGYGFATHKGVHYKIPHIGRTILEDDVEIGAACAIERGALDETVIGKGSKLGDAVVIGHGTRIGPYCLFVPTSGVAGSATVGHHCVAAGRSAITGHVTVGNRVTIGGKAGVTSDLPDDMVVWGFPAIEAGLAKRAYSLIKKLPDMYKTLRKLEKQILKSE
jgi:UDP-3-O-[3-hydroxymyristoyl] glucosamine N-acyltransferase